MKFFTILTATNGFISAEMGCRDGWDTFQGKCYFYSTEAVIKPHAKRYCWEQRNQSQLLLISSDAENNYFAAKVAEKGVNSFWLRINDKNDEGQWVVDRRGYEKPTSWVNQEYFNWNEALPNAVGINSCTISSDGLWNRYDKFAKSEFVCEGDFVELESPQSPNGGRNFNGSEQFGEGEKQRNGAYNDGANFNTGKASASGETNLKCWTCKAKNYAECDALGSLVTCQSNEKSCEYEVRHRWGYVTQIISGCKAVDACMNNKSQNFRHWKAEYTQCRPENRFRHSVCRQCCNTDSCINSPEWWKPKTRNDWSKKMF